MSVAREEDGTPQAMAEILLAHATAVFQACGLEVEVLRR
jgi:hypothetical protein